MGDFQVRELIHDQGDLFFCRALAQHTWLRMTIEAHYTCNQEVSAFLLALDEAFRRVDKPVCRDYDRLFIDRLYALTGYKSLLLARDWPTSVCWRSMGYGLFATWR